MMGSRGIYPTVGQVRGRASRSDASIPGDAIRGFKATATIRASLREAKKARPHIQQLAFNALVR